MAPSHHRSPPALIVLALRVRLSSVRAEISRPERVTIARPYELIDLPRVCDRGLYERTVEKVVAALARHEFVTSIYQVGGVRNPGISDIDLLVVVDDAANSPASPFETLTSDERYLFSHSCFLIPESLAGALPGFALFQAYQHLGGSPYEWASFAQNPAELTALRQQTALEFLVKNLLDLYVQAEYRMVKTRALFQHVKGLRLDLEFLGIRQGPLRLLVDRARTTIDCWYETRPSDLAVAGLVTELLHLLRRTVDETTQHIPLYAPAPLPLLMAPNMVLKEGSAVTLRRRGLRVPRLRGLGERRRFNLQHRSNRFELLVPVTLAPRGSYHAERFDFLRRAKAFAATRFPAFSAPVPPLYYYGL